MEISLLLFLEVTIMCSCNFLYDCKNVFAVLCYCAVVVVHQLIEWFPCDNLSSSLWILLNFELNDPWHCIKVGTHVYIDLSRIPKFKHCYFSSKFNAFFFLQNHHLYGLFYF